METKNLQERKEKYRSSLITDYYIKTKKVSIYLYMYIYTNFGIKKKKNKTSKN